MTPAGAVVFGRGRRGRRSSRLGLVLGVVLKASWVVRCQSLEELSLLALLCRANCYSLAPSLLMLPRLFVPKVLYVVRRLARCFAMVAPFRGSLGGVALPMVPGRVPLEPGRLHLRLHAREVPRISPVSGCFCVYAVAMTESLGAFVC